MLDALVEHRREERVVERGVTEPLLKAVLARVGLMHVCLGHLLLSRNEPATGSHVSATFETQRNALRSPLKLLVESACEEDLEDDYSDDGRRTAVDDE